MSMHISSSDHDDIMVEMNTTPLIDVLLVLIVMLIITIPIQTHSVKLNMPEASNAVVATPPPVVRLEIDFDGSLYWNGEIISSGNALLTHLNEAAATQPQPEIHIRPNKLAKYDVVAKVLANVQRAGITRIGIVGNEQFL